MIPREKGGGTGLLAPFAWLAGLLEPLSRAWAHARLASKVRGAVPASVAILGVPEVVGTGRIQLGEKLLLHRELYFETQGAGSIAIGDEVMIARGAHLVSHAQIRIGSGCMIGEYASIRDAAPSVVAGSALHASPASAAPIVIGDHVWIGRGVTVQPGVTIGDGAVVGANAVVTRDVPRGLVVAGIPARAIRESVRS